MKREREHDFMCDPQVREAVEKLEKDGYLVIRWTSGGVIPHEEIECAVTLFRSLKERGGRYVAVKVDGPLNWTITEPRTQEALLASLETEPAT